MVNAACCVYAAGVQDHRPVEGMQPKVIHVRVAANIAR
jgi:hypothetical protein